MNDAHATSRKQMLKLLRQLARGPCRLQAAENGEQRVAGADQRSYPSQIITLAQSQGLAILQDGRLVATPQASAYIRRALVMGEDGFVEQHGDVASETVEYRTPTGTIRQKVRRNLDESPLGTVSRLKDRDGKTFLPVDAVAAGERLLADFTRGQLQPRVTSSWQPRLSSNTKGSAGGTSDICDSALAARSRFAAAMLAMGPELSGVALDICCFGKGLELVERERQWPARSAKLMLRTALLALSRHYAPPPPKTAGRQRHWGTEDFRPQM